MYNLYNSRLNNYSGLNRKRLVYFQLEVSTILMKLTKINKSFQFIASRKNNLKIPEKQIVQGIYVLRQLVILCCLD